MAWRLPLTGLPVLVTLGASAIPSSTKEGQTMFYQTESKPQGWRAVAVFDDALKAEG